MDLCSKQTIKNLLQKENTKPIKKLGQNFLVSRTVLDTIIKTADIKNSDTILEIGAGIGTLTQKLAQRAKNVIAIEKDKKLIAILKKALQNFDNVKIICADALKTNLQNYKLKTKNYKLVANLPYYITSPLIRKFLETENPPKQMVLMVQKEVAQRICAKPPKMNLLAIAVQFYSQPEIISYVSKKNFWPQPKVDSAIINLILPPLNLPPPAGREENRRAPSNLPSPEWRGETERGMGGKKEREEKKEKTDKKKFFEIARAGFAHPRKQLINNLSVKLVKDKDKIKDWLIKNNINPQARAQCLSLDDWLNLSKML